MKKVPISVFIITKNEEDRILSAIEAVKNFADEIIVIDSGSVDKTCEIASNSGAKVVFNEWKGYGQQKIFGENICKNDWILNIDADEIVLPELANEIVEIFESDKIKDFCAFRIKIVNKFFFEKKPKKFAYYYNQLRIYNKNFAGFKNSSIHDSVEVRGENYKIGQMKNIISHQSFRSISHWLEKINSYSTMQAKEAFEKQKNISALKFFTTPILAFFKAYFVRRYFIYGFNGIIYSLIFSFSRMTKMMKIKGDFKK